MHLIGRLGQDLEMHYTDRGTARTTFSVATNRSWTDANGQVQTETEWSRCVTWGKLAEIAAQYLHKGSRVYLAGRLHTARWEDAQTGAQRSRVEIVVADLILLDRPMPAATAEDEQDAAGAEHTATCSTRDGTATGPPATPAGRTLHHVGCGHHQQNAAAAIKTP